MWNIKNIHQTNKSESMNKLNLTKTNTHRESKVVITREGVWQKTKMSKMKPPNGCHKRWKLNFWW